MPKPTLALKSSATRRQTAEPVDQLERQRQAEHHEAAKKFRFSSPWDTHFVAMGCKTAIRQLCKYLPKSPELATALALDNMADRGEPQGLTLEGAVNNVYVEAPYPEEPEAPPAEESPDSPVVTELLARIAAATALDTLEAVQPDIALLKEPGREEVKTAYKARKSVIESRRLS